MKPLAFPRCCLLLLAAITVVFSTSPRAQAQVKTNWVAYNDFGPGPVPDPGVNDGWGTAPFVTGYDMGFGPGGQLTNLPAGQFPVAELPAGYPLIGQARLVVTPINANGVFGLPATPGYPFPNTPAYAQFRGICDMGNLGSAFGVGAGQAVNLTFTQLNPAMRYRFRGSVVRAGTAVGTHDVRWTLNSITGAASFVSAHTSGGSGFVIPSSPVVGLTLTNGQVAFQSGMNTNGAVVGWDDIVPGPDGSFTVVNQPYNGPTDVNSSSANVGYVLTAIVLTEYGTPTPLGFTTDLPATLTTTQLLSFSLSVKAHGTAPYYQWYKQGVGAIAGANNPTYTIDVAQLGDSGTYYAVVTNALGNITSHLETVTVAADTVAPSIARVIGNATFDGFTVEFSEPVRSTEAADPSNYTLTGPGGPLGVSTATAVAETGKLFGGILYVSSVVLTCDALNEDTSYSVSAVEIVDGVNLPINPAPVSFRSWLRTPASGLLYEAYLNIGGNAISDLTGNAAFPDSPSVTGLIGTFDSRAIFADDSHEGYGSRTRGVFIPPYSGSWRFFMRSDDAGRVFFNPAGAAASGKIQILDEPGCCGDWNKFQSDAFPLVGGQAYYLEALQKEGGGADYIKVAARLDGTGFPPLGSAVAQIDPAALTGSAVGSPAAPSGVAGVITIGQQPASLSVAEGSQVTFSVGASNPNGLPMTFQWRKDGVDIPDATSSAYALVAALGDDNTHYSVQIAMIGALTVSSEASLHVTQDITPPVLVGAKLNSGLDKIVVSFNELLDTLLNTAEDPNNYQVLGPGNTPLIIASVKLRPDGKSVVITLDSATPIQPGSAYRVVVNNVKDLAGNDVAPDSTANFSPYPLSRGFVQFDYYAGIAGNAVQNLTDDPRFAADSPTTTYIIPAFDTRKAFPDDSHEGYGSKIAGVFIPPASGNWIFYLSSDDASQLFFNANGPSASGAALVAEEAQCCHGFADHPTDPQPLEAGKSYYIAALHKEGTGGDYCQVAAKLETDPTPPNALSPIPGSSLGVFLDPSGASVQITQQPQNTRAASPIVQAFTAHSFANGDGGFLVASTGPIGVPQGGPWIYNSPGGFWSTDGTEGCGSPSSSALISRYLVAQASGPITFRLTHRYSFEFDGTYWDGGQVRLSVNDGEFSPVTSFAQNGYTATVGGNNLLTGLEAFGGDSSGYATGTTIDSDANLGNFSTGDRLRLEFVGAWDECSRGSLPNWLVRSVAIVSGSVKEVAPSPATFTVAATGTYGGNNNPPITYVWQKDTGAGFVDIAGAANSATLTIYPEQSDNGAKIRVLVFVPGASVASQAATLTVGPDLNVEQTGPDTVVLSWSTSNAGFSLQQASALLTPATTTWSAVAGQVTVVGERNTVTVTGAGAGTKFYRLLGQ